MAVDRMSRVQDTESIPVVGRKTPLSQIFPPKLGREKLAMRVDRQSTAAKLKLMSSDENLTSSVLHFLY